MNRFFLWILPLRAFTTTLLPFLGVFGSLCFLGWCFRPVSLPNPSPPYSLHIQRKDRPIPITRTGYDLMYGVKTAPHHLTVFFDSGCSHCITFYRTVWPHLKKTFVQTRRLRVTFTPYPVHNETVLFMACCEHLTPVEHQILFECLMELEAPPPTILTLCMEKFGKSVPKPTTTTLKTVLMLTQRYAFEALPMLAFDGKLLSDDNPNNLVHFLQESLR